MKGGWNHSPCTGNGDGRAAILLRARTHMCIGKCIRTRRARTPKPAPSPPSSTLRPQEANVPTPRRQKPLYTAGRVRLDPWKRILTTMPNQLLAPAACAVARRGGRGRLILVPMLSNRLFPRLGGTCTRTPSNSGFTPQQDVVTKFRLEGRCSESRYLIQTVLLNDRIGAS